MTETGFPPHTEHRDWWSRRPRRSRSDSKVAGVAGGLAHYLGVDPILFRVGFVALTILGGVGILAYTLLWLLLPAEGDEVSAGEALLGRGRSSVSPIVAAVLAIAVVISVFATFNWGFPFWPALIIGAVAFHVARKQRRGPFRPGSEWERRIRATADDVAANRWSNAATAGPSWGDPGTAGGSHGWGNWGNWGGGCGGSGRRPAATSPEAGDSPFDTPAFWDASPGDAPTTTQPRVDLRKEAPGPDPRSTAAGAPEVRDTPPAWDPLGAAPFAWDLPEIDLAPPSDVATRTRTASPVIARVTGGLALLVVAVQVLGILAGLWSPAWAMVAASALTVVALGVLAQALRGRTLTLIGQGVFLSFVTLALTVAGFTGTPTFGDRNWAPTSVADVQSTYELSAGNATLDLTGMALPAGDSLVTAVDVGAGDVRVFLPDDVDYAVTCSSNAGRIDCLGRVADGLHNEVGPMVADLPGRTAKVTLDVHVGAGNVTVEVAR
ncbi:PspC domain-containing protein [Nakamurella deserti]|uniref:PspC domain-containing protein n=1 Tax=Nakamurella deserti TaxID=2164074 RepID=UPI000DBE22D1|nr:PspC domain-containing protein [Nakamurella deserti]